MYTPAKERYNIMEYNRCGRSGLLLPKISLGLWHNFGDASDYENMRQLCFTAFDNGITQFDLANNYGPAYGSAEKNFGRILKEDLMPYRDELIITTKAGFDMWEGPYGNWGSRKYLLASLDQSLKRMGLDYVDIFYEMTQDGLTVEKGKLANVVASPHSDAKVELKLQVPNTGKIYLKLIYRLKKEMPLLEHGYELGFDEMKLANEDDRNRQAVKWLEQEKITGTIAVKENDKQIVLQAKDFTYVLDKRTGLFENMQFAGRSYINHPMELNIWRAPTDNDMYIKLEWKKAHYDAAYTRAYRIEVLQNKHGVLIMEHLAVVADTVQKILDVEMTLKINEDGKIEAVIEAVKDKEFPDLPRFGIRMFLNKKMDEITYFGMGPQESYRDKHQASCHGLFRSKVAQMHEDYIRPQENGSHYDCDYVELTNGQCGIVAVSKNPFSFNASVYTQEELERVSHNYELKESDSTVFCMDYAMNGIGSNSCGPDVLDKYRFDEEAFKFQFELIPFVKG